MPDDGSGRMDLAREASLPAEGLIGPVGDGAPGHWVRERTGGAWGTVGAIMPSGFPAYARIFHPAQRAGDEVRWAEVAAANGRVAHPAMEWVSITGSARYLHESTQPGIWDEAPSEGSLPLAQARALVAVLGRHTSTPERCWFAVWEGYGDMEIARTAARLRMPNRPMVLFRGRIDAWLAAQAADPFGRSPSLWWPEDRAWCVATDVDLMTTYLGASIACVEAVLAAPGLEAAPVTFDLPTTWDQDTVNQPPEGFDA